MIALRFSATAAMIGAVALGAWSAAAQPLQPYLYSTTGAGYNYPTPIPITPGEVITLFVRGLATSGGSASTLPLPTELAGVSVLAEEGGGAYSARLAIFSVQPLGCGRGLSKLCSIFGITVEVPTDAQVCIYGQQGCQGGAVRLLVSVLENGVVKDQTEFEVEPAAFHIVNSCDTITGGPGVASCQFEVLHADGTFVTETSPARPGENLIVYAVGLGQTNPIVPTGEAASSAIPVVNPGAFSVTFSVPPVTPSTSPTTITGTAPSYIGLTPRYVGLYQVNLEVPKDFPANPPRCVDYTTHTKLTLTASGWSDTVPVCIQPGQ